MAFCTNCGSPLAPGSTFCTHCGARAAASATQPPPGQPPQAPGAYPPPAAKGSGIGKILLIIGGVLVLLGVLAIGGLVLTGFWVKKQVETAAGRMGVTDAPAPKGRARRVADVCALLSAAEAARATGLAIERAESRGNECRYFGSAAQPAEQGQQQAQEAMRKMRENKAANEQEAARALEDLMKGLAASGQASEQGPLFQIAVKYGEEARQQETGYRTAMGMMGAITGAKEGASKPTGLEGVGDRAYLAPLATGLFMMKGDAWVEISGPGLPNREALIALARTVAGKL
ncbi:MAG: zinc ribbon domain-containing protein [Bryobacteraceae bacterium]